MNPTATLRFRRATALCALCWALVALILAVSVRLDRDRLGPPLLLERLVGDPWHVAGAGEAAAAAGVEAGDSLLAIDGLPVERAFRADDRFRAGRPNLYRIEGDDGAVRDVALRPVRPRELVSAARSWIESLLPLIGIVYLGIGIATWRLRPGRGETWALFLFCCAVAVELFQPGPPGRAGWYLYWANLPLIGATCFHLFTTYPIEPAWVVRFQRLRLLPYLAAALLGPAAAAEVALGLPGGLAKTAALAFTLSLAIGCLVIVVHERRRLRDTQRRDRADVMLLGALVSFAPAVLVVLVENLFRSPYPWYAAYFSFFVFPLAVGYGIARKQLFEIRVMARSSAAYGAVTLAITGIYAFLVVFADAAVAGFEVNARSPWFSVAFLFCAILAFNPLRTRMQKLVDGFFDRDHALYRRAVREISEAMVSMLSTKEVVDRILVALTETMTVHRTMVLLQEEERRVLAPAASRGEWDDEALATEFPLSHPLSRRLLAERDAMARADFDDEPDPEAREACRDVFDGLEVELLVPILFGSDLLGVIAVGRKLTGDPLSGDDRQLLLTLANQSSIAIENAKAFDEIAELNATLEARVEERTRELRTTQNQLVQSEKMRSLGQLVAGVAHELNNPIGFVHANLKLLHEYTRRLVEAQGRGDDTAKIEDAIERLLTRSQEGTERVKQIVADLRTFSRMDRAELVEVDPNEEIERTLGLMAPRLRGTVELERDFADLPRIHCYAGQLNQVFMNLLINACDALETQGGGHIRIVTRPRPDGVRIEFHDDGPGMPPEVQARIFEPFYTTKPVGQGTGLGLSISYGIVERHGGRMLVGSAPGQGTSFVVELPLVAKPPAEEEPV